jgi:hypothetical protein
VVFIINIAESNFRHTHGHSAWHRTVDTAAARTRV